LGVIWSGSLRTLLSPQAAARGEPHGIVEARVKERALAVHRKIDDEGIPVGHRAPPRPASRVKARLSRSIRIRAGYSWRNALMGSARVARRAGMYVAKRATRNRAPGTTR